MEENEVLEDGLQTEETTEITEAVEETTPEVVEETTEEVSVSIGDEPVAKEAAPDWVRDLRKANREKDRRIRELEARLPVESAAQLPKKPKLEDHDYDAEKFEEAMETWYEHKRRHEVKLNEAKQAEEQQRKEWESRLDSYGKAKADLRVPDFEEAEEAVQDLLNVTQQGVIVQGAKNPALVIYAIGKNTAKGKELANIKDPVKFAFAVADLERELKVQPKKSAPPPEKTVTAGTARVSGAVDSTLDRLREEAAKTGNFDKVLAYKRQLKEKQRK